MKSRSPRRQGPITFGMAVVLFGALLSGCSFSGVAAQPAVGSFDSIRANGRITVASSLAHPPFEYLAEDNETPEGIDIDVVTEIGHRLGLTVEFQDVRFATIPAGLYSRRFDAAVSAMRDSNERRRYADFVDYLTNYYKLLVTAENPAMIQSTADLCGHTVGGVSGETALTFVAEYSNDCRKAGKAPIATLEYATTAAVLMALKTGRISAYYDTTATSAYTAKTDPAFMAVGRNEHKVTYGIAFTQGNKNLVEAVRGALQSIMDDGTYAKILARWNVSELALPAATVNKG